MSNAMENLRKAAILLLTLEKPLAAELLDQLPRDLVESVMLEMANLDDVTREQRQSVLSEFYSMSKQDSELIHEEMAPDIDLPRPALSIDGACTGDALIPFGFLQEAVADNLASFIVDEHPQTIALIMSHLRAPLAAEVLNALPSVTRLNVVRRVANMEDTDPDVLRDVESSLENRMKASLNQRSEQGVNHELVV